MKLVTNKSKNLLYRIVNEVNTTVQFGTSYAIATQQTADTKALVFTIQGRSATDIVGLTTVYEVSLGKLTTTFTTPSSTRYNYIRFGLDGSQRNTMCNCPIDLKPSTTYTFTCNFTNITQGSISWKDMMLVEGSEAGDYEPYSYNLLDKWKFPSTQTVNRVTFTNNGDGTITADGIPPSATYYVIDTFNRISGHRYVVSCNYNRNVFTGLKMETQSGSGQVNFNPDNIFTATSTENTRVYIDVYDDHIGPSVVIPQLYDLTLMYGAGNEPTTVEQFYTDHPELKVSPLGFIGLKNIEINNKNIKRLRYKTADGVLDLGIIPSNSGYILNKYNNLSEELLEENIEKDNINYYIPDKTNISLNKVEGKTNKIVQLIDKTVFVTSGTKVGLTFTCDRNTGSITVNGTSTASSYWNPSGALPLINNHKYLICGNYVGSGISELGLLNQRISDRGNGDIGAVVASAESPRNSWGITWDNGTTFNNVTIYPQVFDLTAMYGFGNEPTTVEQFKKDYPQFFDEKLDGIWNVRTSGISTTGKNLFDINKWITHQYDVGNGTLVERLSNGVICQGDNGTDDGAANYSNGWFRPMYYQYPNSVYLQAGTYTLSADYTMIENSVVNTARVNCYLYGDHDYNIANTTSVTVGNTVRIKNTYTVEEGYYYPVFTLNSGKVKIENIQIELNSTETTYESYQENKIDFLSTQTLNGINGVNDYIEVIDKGNGLYDLKKTQNIDSVDLGTLDWAADGANFYSSSIYSVIKPPTNDNSVGNYTCQKYVNVALSKSFVDGDFGVNSFGRIYFRNSAYTTAAAFKTAMNGVILYYQLKTPVTTTIATNLTYNQVSAIRTNGGLLLVNDNNNQKYAQPNVTLKENYQYKNG